MSFVALAEDDARPAVGEAVGVRIGVVAAMAEFAQQHDVTSCRTGTPAQAGHPS